MKSLLTSLFVFLFFTTAGLTAQDNSYKLMDKSTMQIEGTSTIHDWTCDVQEINADISLNTAALEGTGENGLVNSLSLTIPVEKIESGKGRMNGKMYDALKKDDHPNITFELSSAELVNGTYNDGKFELNATGQLTIAGVTRGVSFPVEGLKVDNSTFRFSGNYGINMKDYEVDPPSAVFGTIKSGEEVTVTFEIFLSNS